jgi:hypothetical protein
MTTANTKFQNMTFDPATRVMRLEWVNSAFLNDDFYKEELLWQLHQVETLRPRFMSVSVLNMQFMPSLELQEWVNIAILPNLFGAGVEKMGILLPEDVALQMSLDLQIDDNPAYQSNVAYFTDEERLGYWLNL